MNNGLVKQDTNHDFNFKDSKMLVIYKHSSIMSTYPLLKLTQQS